MPKRILEGEIVSDKTDKTVTVLVERRYRHPVYKKYIKRTDKYAAHDEQNQFKTGDRVQIIECRPISKTKTWTVMVDGKEVPISTPKEKKEAAKSKHAAKKEAAKTDAAKTAPAKKTAPKKDKKDK